MLVGELYVLDPAERQSRIDNGGRISYFAFEVVSHLFTGISVVTIIVRLIIRIHARHKLYIDDYLLLLGLACLGATIYLHIVYSRLIFLYNALRIRPRIILHVNELMQLQDALKFLYSYLAFIWTTTFSVKFSFLIFFKQLIDRVSRPINIYHWIVVVFTFVSWIFIVLEPFILCRHFGFESLKCMPASSKKIALGLRLNTLVAVLDIVTDVFIVSIPIIIIRKAKIKLRQKLVLGVFLCLSIAMIVMAVIRISGYRMRELDMVWQLFWLHMEACIALIMASLTTFRSAFVTIASRKKKKKKKEGLTTSMHRRLLARLNRRNRNDEREKNEHGLPAIPGVTLTGVRTFIERNNRSMGETRSEYGGLEEEDHHLNEAEMNSNLDRKYFSVAPEFVDHAGERHMR